MKPRLTTWERRGTDSLRPFGESPSAETSPSRKSGFAEEAKLMDLRHLSDYVTGDFGRAPGLLVEEMKLLARAVVIVDRQGLAQCIQVAPEITHLPDMEAAFEKAIALSKEK